jgi:hypothetical protein
MKIKTFFIFGIASISLLFSACSNMVISTANNATPNNSTPNKANNAAATPTANKAANADAAKNTAASGIRSVDFLNYTYESTVCADDLGISKTIKVAKGKFKDGDNYYNVKDNNFMYADVNGDGREDAVVTIDCGSTAGTLRSFEIHAYIFEDGKAKRLATLDNTELTEDYTKHYPDGYVFQIPQNGVTVDNDGTLVVDVMTDGSFAMPANISTFIYKLSGDKFNLTAKPKKRKFKS